MKLTEKKNYRLIFNFMPSFESGWALFAEGGTLFQLGFIALNLLELEAKTFLFRNSEEPSPSKRQPGDMVAGILFGSLVNRWLFEVWNTPS